MSHRVRPFSYIIKHGISFQQIIIIAIYFTVFTGNIFAFITDSTFMGVDAGSITTAINDMFAKPYYDLNASYHTKYYGWTYVVINFFLLAPIVGVLKLIGNNDPAIINFCIRFILFFISLATVLIFYQVAHKITKHKWLSLLASIFFMLNYTTSHYWYTIHPESTGMLFSLLGLYFLLKFQENNNRKNYFTCVAMLVLSSLSKQPFFIISLSILGYMLFSYCNWKLAHLTTFIKSSKFWSILCATSIFSLLIAFLIHPYAFINFGDFITYQRALAGSATASDSLLGGFIKWINLTLSSPLIIIHSTLTIATFALATIKKVPPWFVFSTVISSIIMLIFMVVQHQFYSLEYIAPLYSFFILNICIALCHVFKRDFFSSSQKIAATVCIGLVFTISLLSNTAHTISTVIERTLLHNKTTKKLSWNYIAKLPIESKIVWNPSVAMPPTHIKYACHIWRGCNNIKNITLYNPEYFIINKDYRYMDHNSINTYIKKHNFCVIDTLSPTNSSSQAFITTGGFINTLQKIKYTVNAWANNSIMGPTITVYAPCPDQSTSRLK